MMKTGMMMATIKLLAMIVMMSALSGCGGATFTKGNMNPFKDNEKIGILVAKYEVLSPGMFTSVHVHEKVDKAVADKMTEVMKEKLIRSGFTPVVIPADEKVADLVKRYKSVPRNFRRVISEPDKVDLGNLDELFKENGINFLLVFEGESVIRPTALKSFLSAGVSTAVGLAFNTVVGGGGQPFTYTYTGVAERDGTLSYYDREQFSKHGDVLAPQDRDGIGEAIVRGWVKSRQ